MDRELAWFLKAENVTLVPLPRAKRAGWGRFFRPRT